MKISICIGSSCHLRGSEEVVKKFQKLVKNQGLEDQLELCGSFCMGACSQGVSVKVDDIIYHVAPEEAEHFFENVIQKRGEAK